MDLLPAADLVKTNELDQGHWNHARVLGAIERTRYRLALDLLGVEFPGRDLS